MRRDWSSNPGVRGRRREMAIACSVLSLAAVATASFTPTAGAQGSRTRVAYTVEFRTTSSPLDQNCPVTGTDVLTGTIVGFEPPLPNEDNHYVGTLTRTTRMTMCGTRRNAAGEDVVCSINFVGNGVADVIFTLYEGERGGYLQYITNRAQWAALLPPRPAGRSNSAVTGTCEPAELSQLQRDYDEGQTAGSPSGQPFEVPRFPPLGARPAYPLRFPAAPPQSIWTLTVFGRRP